MRSPGLQLAAAFVAGTLLLGGAVSCSSDAGSDTGPTTSRADATSTTAPSTTSTSPPPASAAVLDAACDATLVATPSAPIVEPLLTEASGVAPTTGRTWINNDSGDRPRLYGLAADGSVQVVDVTGAMAQDWEDLAVVSGGDDPHLWIADTGDNAKQRKTVVLYRVPIPAEGETSVAAQAVTVTYPDGAHDVEAAFADPDGDAVYLLTKFEYPSKVFRVDGPAGGGVAEAVAVGTFPAGRDGKGVVTGAAISADRRAIAVRTYDASWLYPLADGQDPAQALAQADPARCQAPAGAEGQGEAIGFLADGSGYVTIGEGTNAVITTIRPR
ncbi:hypothetical protein BH10ACT1_BH10ACT1_31630 [soil metagenome]